jgi:hypothetical protein
VGLSRRTLDLATSLMFSHDCCFLSDRFGFCLPDTTPTQPPRAAPSGDRDEL